MSIYHALLLICLILLPVIWSKSHVFRYWAKLSYYSIVVALISGFFVCPVAIFRPRDVRNLRFNLTVKPVVKITYIKSQPHLERSNLMLILVAAWDRPVGWVWLKLFSVFGIEYDVRNEKYMQSDKPYVLVSNHQSSLDVLGMMYSLPDRCTAMAKNELFYTGTFGLAGWLCGIIFIKRHDKKKAISTMDTTAKHIHENNLKLWIFPEGTRSSDGAMLPFKKGAFHLAVQAQIPIVPVVFSSYKNFYDKKRKIFESGKVIIHALPPVSTEGLKTEDVTELTERVRNMMIPAFEMVSEEVTKTSPPIESRI